MRVSRQYVVDLQSLHWTTANNWWEVSLFGSCLPLSLTWPLASGQWPVSLWHIRHINLLVGSGSCGITETVYCNGIAKHHRPLRLRSQPFYNTPPCEASIPLSIGQYLASPTHPFHPSASSERLPEKHSHCKEAIECQKYLQSPFSSLRHCYLSSYVNLYSKIQMVNASNVYTLSILNPPTLVFCQEKRHITQDTQIKRERVAISPPKQWISPASRSTVA